EVVVQAAVRDEVDVPPRNLPVDHAADIDAGLAHEISPQLDDDGGAGQQARRVLDETVEMAADARNVERRLVREVWDPEAAADVEAPNGRRRGPGQPGRELDRARLRFDDRFGA